MVWTLLVALAIVVVTIGVEKLTNRALPVAAWIPFVVAFDLAVVVSAAIALFTGPNRLDAAVAIDRKYQLNERLSTALSLSDDLRDTPAGSALMKDAIRRVSDLDVTTEFGLRLPRLAWVPLIPGVLAVALLLVPPLAQLKAQAKIADKIDKKLVVEQTKALGKKIAEQRKEMDKTKFPEADKILAQIEKATDDLTKAPPAQKDKALVELNKLTDALKDRRKQLGSPEQINRQLQQLKDLSNQGPADQFAKDLAKGDYMKAAQELKKLQEKMASGKMSESEKKALKEQVAEMARQLQKLANLDERRKQLEEARKNGGLSEQEFQREMAKLDEQAKNLQKLQKLAQQLSQAQEHMAKGDMKKAAEAMGMSREQLSEMAKNLQELESLDSALAELQDAKNGMTGDGLNQLGDAMENFGLGRERRNGQSGLGRGRGQGDRPEAPDKTAEYTTKVKQQIGKGKAVVEGTAPSNTPVKGLSQIDVQGEIETSTGNLADALTNQKVPRKIEKHIRVYFDQINKGK